MRDKSPQPTATLTLRDLNRATLARQMLLQRESLGVVEAVERLAGMQAQYSRSPYIGLWSRLQDFKHEQLTDALNDRTIIKASLMRWTLHLASARDYPFYITAVTSARTSGWRNYAEKMGLDVPAMHKSLLEFVDQPRTQKEIKAFLKANAPPVQDLHTREHLWYVASSMGWLVHTPPSGTWRYFGQNPYIAAHRWLGDDLPKPSSEDAVTHLVRRYLAGYGPATRADAMQFTGLRKVSGIDAAIRALGDEVIAFVGEGGNILYDLRDAPRPSGDTPAPVRFLPKWDNLLLAHQDRERVLPSHYRKTVIKVNGDVLPTFLVNGVVAGLWSSVRERDSAFLNLEPLEAIDPSIRSQLEEEGLQLIRFIEPDSISYNVRIAD